MKSVPSGANRILAEEGPVTYVSAVKMSFTSVSACAPSYFPRASVAVAASASVACGL
jgi:hypothetical protein